LWEPGSGGPSGKCEDNVTEEKCKDATALPKIRAGVSAGPGRESVGRPAKVVVGLGPREVDAGFPKERANVEP
jgi:hypothetical protein